MLAIDAKLGEERWRQKFHGYVFGSPAVTTENIFIGDYTGRFYSLSRRSGDILSTFESQSFQTNASAVLTPDGYLSFQKLVEGKDPALYATAVDVMNAFDTLGPFVSSAVIFKQTLFVAASNGILYAFQLEKK